MHLHIAGASDLFLSTRNSSLALGDPSAPSLYWAWEEVGGRDYSPCILQLDPSLLRVWILPPIELKSQLCYSLAA